MQLPNPWKLGSATGPALRSEASPAETLREVLVQVAAAPDRVAAILDGHEAPLIAFTAERRIVTANPAGEHFFGYDRHALDGRPTDVIVPARFRQPNAPPQAAVEDLTTVEIPGLCRDGREVATAWTFGFVPASRGPLFVMILRDLALQMNRERELEDRFRAVYQNALDGIMLIDDDLRIIDANPAACRLVGRARDQLLGMATTNLMPPGARDTRLMGEFRSAGAMAGEGEILLPDGSVHRAEFGAVANVSPGVHLSIFRDIEDRKRADEAQRFLDEASTLMTSSLDYDQTLSSVARLAVPRMADWVSVDLLEEDGSIRAVAVTHIEPAKIALANELRRLQQPAIDDVTGVGAVIRTGRADLIETVTDDVLVAALGGRMDLLESVRRLGLVSAMIVPMFARGKVIGAISFVSAESRRRYGPSDLAFAEELSRRAGDAVANALYVRDLHIANQTKEMFLERAEHLQATATKLVRAAGIQAIARAFESDDPASPVAARAWSLYLRSGDHLDLLASTGGASATGMALRHIPLADENPLADVVRTGNPIWLENREQRLARYPRHEATLAHTGVEARAALPLHAGDESIGALGVVFERPQTFDADQRAYLTAVADLWAQALHRAQLADAEREAIRRALEAETLATRKKDEFLAMLGHELRNPLAPIVTAISLLRVRGRATNRELEILDRQARHLVRLVDDLLDITRITSGKLTLKRGRVAVPDVVAQAIESTSPMFNERQVRLYTELPPAPMVVDGDRERLVQVVGNILVNAAKFTPAGKSVHVAASMHDGDARIVVRDEGCGIDAELLPRVFDLFSQGRQGSDRATGGLGLGLAIAQSIVLAHSGRIDVSSPGPNQGTTIVVRLPLLSAGIAPSTPVAGVATGVSAAGKHRVLIVDDNEDSAAMLAEFLGEMGYECYIAGNAQHALSLSLQVAPHAAILDIGLPDIDGHDLARQMLDALADHPPKLIALTGYARETDRERALEAGFLDHMAKPVEMSKLTARLSDLLGG